MTQDPQLFYLKDPRQFQKVWDHTGLNVDVPTVEELEESRQGLLLYTSEGNLFGSPRFGGEIFRLKYTPEQIALRCQYNSVHWPDEVSNPETHVTNFATFETRIYVLTNIGIVAISNTCGLKVLLWHLLRRAFNGSS